MAGDTPVLGDQLLTAKQVARILNVNVRTVRRRIADNTIPVIRIGRAVRVSPGALEKTFGKEVTGHDR